MRYLGNDEIYIIWLEYIRDYRRGIIFIEFGDVFIIIYFLFLGFYRIEINKKVEVFFYIFDYNNYFRLFKFCNGICLIFCKI